MSPVAAQTQCDLFINEAGEDVSHLNISFEGKRLRADKERSSSTIYFFFLLGRGGVKRKKASKTQIITMPTTSDTTRAEPKNFLIHLNVKATFAALPPCESPQAAKRPVVSHLFTPAAAGCHWDSEGEIP